jgi:hypothetical protein
MKRILVAIEAFELNRGSLQFACYLGRLTKSKIIGVLLHTELEEESHLSKLIQGTAYLPWEESERSEKRKTEKHLIEKCVGLFKEICVHNDVSYSINHDFPIPARELIDETRFADLLVVNSAISLTEYLDEVPSDFIKHTLTKAECPVIVAPENFERVDEIVFSFDGSGSSVFAIKQFTYLFPQLLDRKVSFVQVNEHGVWDTDNQNKLKDLLLNPHNDINFEAIKEESGEELSEWLSQRKNIFLVMGAFGTNILSPFTKRSTAEFIIGTMSQPIFIAHL